MNWKNKFEDYILERGFEYYINNCVINLKIQENEVMATVNGTDVYEVVIDSINNRIGAMYCSCPHATSGHNCKHMAAVLYEFNDRYDDKKVVASENDDTVKELIAEADEATVRDFLVSLLEEDERLKVRFKNLVYKEISKEDLNQYKELVNMAISNNQDCHGFISYYQASDFYSDILVILDTDVRLMLDNDNYEQAFELTNYILLSIGNVDIDDSGGCTGMLADACYHKWIEIINHVDIKLKRSMYEWFVTHLNGSVIDYMEDYIEMILMECFNETEFINLKLIFTDLKVNEAKNDTDSWSRNYNTGKWAAKHLTLMNIVDKNWEEQVVYCKKHWEIPSVRKYYIEKCVENKDYQGAIKALEESQNLDKAYPGLLKEYSIKLKEIYKLTGNKEQYINKLWQLILKDDAGNLNVYKELKDQYSHEEWLRIRERVFSELPSYGHIDVLYHEEKLYDRLLACIQSQMGLFSLQQYEGILVKMYPQEVLKKYKVEVERMAIHTSDRKNYQRLVHILRKMSKFPGGKEIVSEIAQEWKSMYSNRRAMMDELNKL